MNKSEITNQTKPQETRINNSPWGWLYAIFSALACFMLIEKGTQLIFEYHLPAIIKISVYLLFYWFFWRYIFNRPNAAQTKSSEKHPAYEWPVSGPIKALGHSGMLFTFLPTLLLSNFNPFQVVQQFKMLFGQAKAAKRLAQFDGELENYQTKVQYRLPLNGEWLVYNGGLSQEASHSWEVLNQRYAYDFVKADEDYSRHQNKGNRLTDYYCYEQEIVAAADGEVVATMDGINPAPLVGYGVADFLCRHFAGNHIVVKHAEGEYGFYAHLIRGSLKHKEGDKVKRGEVIGLCGHTGHSSEPHLHFHLQDKADLFKAVGLPIRFHNIAIENQKVASPAEITRGSRVANLSE
ncbi:MAG: M23 family metallopeptidase [Kangiellaceae bacterium]|nr:M23 family metallopeptidase [Kangiellaceae bacterium]MCW9015587.1 M23 family metallopeptidase [Kangiellaceae bacterium]